ncbi:MAG TPA: hypothetical protein VFK13_12065 [Gemmatimonadaceae bacterium]|nr:hypothetical protein [Gemmatimonadaceae bacterium]
MKRPSLRGALLCALVVVLAILGTGWVIGTASENNYDAAEAALRHGILLAAYNQRDTSVIVTVSGDSAALPGTTFRQYYRLSFVDSYPFDSSSLRTLFTRSAFVWLVCLQDGRVFDGEVRRVGDGRWAVALSDPRHTPCQGRVSDP